MNKIIKLLKQARLTKGFNQSQLGAKLGLPQSHISKIEKGGTDPRLSTAMDMARVLDQELVLVPREMLPLVQALVNGEDKQKPRWAINDEDDL